MDWKTINIAPEIVAKYLAKGKTPPSKPKQEWVTRYHRTKTSNAPSIEQSGLLTHNPNVGDNTWLPGKADYHKIWLELNPKELAEFWIDSDLPAIKNKNTLTSQDVLPVFSQIKHKLMVPDDRYTGWEHGSYGAYPPTADIDFKAAATLLEALQRSDRKDLLPQARDILFDNLQYYK